MKKMNKEIKGIIPPLLTPFTPEGEVYEKGLRRLVDFLILHRVDGLFLCGTYGSGPLMTIEQRKRVAEIVIDQVKDRIPVIVHVGSADTKSTLDLASHAEEIGADAVASVPPYYYSHSEDVLLNHYRRLINSVKIPTYLYNNPKTSGNPVSPELLAKIAELGLSGVKDSSFDLLNFYFYVMAVKRPGFKFIVGTEALYLPATQAGAVGAVCGLANVFPEVLVDLRTSIEKRDFDNATKLQAKTLRIRKVMKMGPTIPICHSILKMRGVDAGVPKLPFLPISGAFEYKIREELAKLNLI